MTTTRRGEDGPFRDIDSKLTIYALANGMDLLKEPFRRRMSWYRDGRERGVVIQAPEDGVYRILVGLWRAGTDEPVLTEELTQVTGSRLLLDSLAELMDRGQERANAL